MFARIFRPAKTAMQSGKAKSQLWVLEFDQQAARRLDPLMGWTSADDMPSSQLRLTFDSRKDAVTYAKSQGIPHRIIEPSPVLSVQKSYSDNFAYKRRTPWTH